MNVRATFVYMLELLELSLRVCRINSMQLLRQLLFKCDTNIEVMVFSYSITDGWMRQLQKLRREYDIVYVTLVLDRDVMIRHREKLVQLQCVAEAVYLTDSHAKLYYVKSDNYQAVTIT